MLVEKAPNEEILIFSGTLCDVGESGKLENTNKNTNNNTDINTETIYTNTSFKDTLCWWSMLQMRIYLKNTNTNSNIDTDRSAEKIIKMQFSGTLCVGGESFK